MMMWLLEGPDAHPVRGQTIHKPFMVRKHLNHVQAEQHRAKIQDSITEWSNIFLHACFSFCTCAELTFNTISPLLFTTCSCSIRLCLSVHLSPNLTWRDMQHLSVLTSKRNQLHDEVHQWRRNGVGLEFNHLFGYGVLDAGGMVKMAKEWRTVPERFHCVAGSIQGAQWVITANFVFLICIKRTAYYTCARNILKSPTAFFKAFVRVAIPLWFHSIKTRLCYSRCFEPAFRYANKLNTKKIKRIIKV